MRHDDQFILPLCGVLQFRVDQDIDTAECDAGLIRNPGAKMSDRLEMLNKARERMIDDRDAHAKVLAAPFDRDKAERARTKFIEIQALIDALDRAISGEKIIPAKS
jgi:hypothetical protein